MDDYKAVSPSRSKRWAAGERFGCSQCRKTFTAEHTRPLDDMGLAAEKAEAIRKLLVEGMSIRSIERVSQAHRDTIQRLCMTLFTISAVPIEL